MRRRFPKPGGAGSQGIGNYAEKTWPIPCFVHDTGRRAPWRKPGASGVGVEIDRVEYAVEEIVHVARVHELVVCAFRAAVVDDPRRLAF